jgi:hypothetical protein
MTENVYNLLADPQFLKSILDGNLMPRDIQYSSHLHPTQEDIDEAKQILLHLDEEECCIPQEELIALKKRIKVALEI